MYQAQEPQRSAGLSESQPGLGLSRWTSKGKVLGRAIVDPHQRCVSEWLEQGRRYEGVYAHIPDRHTHFLLGQLMAMLHSEGEVVS